MLIDETGFIADAWVRANENTSFDDAKLIVPFERLDEALATDLRSFGIQIGNTVRPSEIAPFFERLALISIAFPSFSDGRGFSLAQSLRHAGFKGELRAFGPLIADQFAHALGCGFSSVEVPDELAARQPAAQWQAAAASLSLAYQRGYAHGVNILDQRRSARHVACAA